MDERQKPKIRRRDLLIAVTATGVAAAMGAKAVSSAATAGRRDKRKLVDGQWNRISWDQAIDEIGDSLMEIRAKSGPESVYWLGSAKFTNEAADVPNSDL
jgi:hypothetical protein